MRRVADWAVIDGAVHRRMALVLDAQGVVRDVVRAAPHERCSAGLEGAVVVPGATDACALGGLLPDTGDARCAAVLDAFVQLVVATPVNELRRRARALFAAAVRAGVTTVALPHLAPQLENGPCGPALQKTLAPAHADPEAQPAPHPYPVATAFADAADDVGLRLALLDAVVLRGPARALARAAACTGPPASRAAAEAWVRCSHADLEAAVHHLDGMVRHLLVRQSPPLSWGLSLPRPALLGADAAIALRLRLGHLPTVVVDGQEPFVAHAQHRGIAGISGATLAAQAAASGALDGCCGWLVSAPEALPTNDVAALEADGVCLLRAPAPRVKTESIPWAWGSASGATLDPYGPCPWWATALAPRATAQDSVPVPPARIAANALGLRGGTLRPDTWADYSVLRPPAGEALPADRTFLLRALAGGADAPPLAVAEVYVAGHRIYAADLDGVPP